MIRDLFRARDERSGPGSGRFVFTLLLGFALASAGCDRLRTWLALAGEGRRSPTEDVSAGLGAYDCPPGILRCVDGRVERSIGGAIDGRTLEWKGCPFELLDPCEGRCMDDQDHLEDELPDLCLDDAAFRQRHPRAGSVSDASTDAAPLEE